MKERIKFEFNKFVMMYMDEKLLEDILREHRDGDPLKIGVSRREKGKLKPHQVRCIEGEHGELMPLTVGNAIKVAQRFTKDGNPAWVQRLHTDAFYNKTE